MGGMKLWQISFCTRFVVILMTFSSITWILCSNSWLFRILYNIKCTVWHRSPESLYNHDEKVTGRYSNFEYSGVVIGLNVSQSQLAYTLSPALPQECRDIRLNVVNGNFCYVILLLLSKLLNIVKDNVIVSENSLLHI